MVSNPICRTRLSASYRWTAARPKEGFLSPPPINPINPTQFDHYPRYQGWSGLERGLFYEGKRHFSQPLDSSFRTGPMIYQSYRIIDHLVNKFWKAGPFQDRYQFYGMVCIVSYGMVCIVSYRILSYRMVWYSIVSHRGCASMQAAYLPTYASSRIRVRCELGDAGIACID